MKRWKRILSMLLVCCLVVGMLLSAAVAAESDSDVDDWASSEVEPTNDPQPSEQTSALDAQTSQIQAYASIEDTYIPYDGASYALTYSENEDRTLTITGYTGTAEGELVLPESIEGKAVTSIGGWAFSGCSGFTGDLIIPDSVTSIEAGAFFECNGFNGSLKLGLNLQIIGSEYYSSTCNGAFYGCSGFTGSLVIPDGITSIGCWTFSGCSGFTGSLTIGSSVTNIGGWAFSGCSGFTGSLTIGNSVTNIERGAFQNCSGFTGDLIIPDSVVSIEDNAFTYCSGFNGSLKFGSNLQTIGSGKNLPYNNGVFYGCSGFTGDLVIPDSVTNIGDHAFQNCSGFTGSLTISDSVTEIGSSTFFGCSGFTGSLTIGDSVTNIGSSAFSGCSGFTGSLTIPDSVTSIVSKAFYGCNGFTGSLTIGNRVTIIGESAFSGCSGLTGDLVIPDSVTSIGNSAFRGCSGFTGSLKISDSITDIEDYVFSGCSGFTGSLTIGDSVTEIGAYAFSGCSGFTGDLIIPDSVIYISGGAFYDCAGFNGELKLGLNLQTIGMLGGYYGAFTGCNGFTGSLIIPDSVTEIKSNAFAGCSGFTGSLTIGDSVAEIGSYAFSHCSGFTSAYIPSSVEQIGSGAFDDCGGLIDVYYASSQEDWENIDTGFGNGLHTSVTIHYNSTGPDASTDNGTSIRFLSGWDDTTRRVTFGYSELISPYTYTVADDVDVSNISELLNEYVSVTMEQSDSILEYIVTDIQPVESAIGTVSATGEHSLTIDGTEYPVREDYVLGTYDGQEILYHIYDGTIVGFTALEEKTGTLEAWNSSTGMLTIDGVDYPTNFMTDLSFQANIDQKLGTEIEYYVAASGSYRPVLSVIYYETKIGMFSHYDPLDNSIYVDGTAYPVDSDKCSPDTNALNGKQVFFLLRSGKVVHIDAFDALVPELRIVLSPVKHYVTYENNALSSGNLNQTVRVYYSCSYDFPEQYDEASIYAASDIQAIQLSSVEWSGSSQLSFSGLDLSSASFSLGEHKSASVSVTINNKYTPSEENEALDATCTVKGTPIGGGDELTAYGTMNVVVKNVNTASGDTEDSSEVTALAKAAGDELSDTNIPFTLNPYIMKNVFGISGKTLRQLEQEIFTVIIMSEIPEETLQQKIDEKVLTKLFTKWKPDVSATNYTLPLVYEIETKKYGRVTVRFDCEIQVHGLSSSTTSMYVNVYYTVINSEEGGLSADYEFLGGGVNYDIRAFADAAWNLVEGELKSAYNTAWGNSANEVAEWLFSDTVKKILKANNTSFKDEYWKLCTWPAVSILDECPTDIYIYDSDGTLCGAIEDDLVTMSCDEFSLYAENGVKYISNLDDSYSVKYVATGNGTMDVIVTEYAGFDVALRQIEYLQVPLALDEAYTQTIPGEVRPPVETYSLTSDSSEKVEATNEISLLDLNPAEDEATEVTIEGISAADDLTYNGSAQIGYAGTPSSEYIGDYEIFYVGRNGTTYNSSEAPTDAGDYIVTIKVPEENEIYTGSISLDFTIAKAAQTAPSAPELSSKTRNSVTLKTISSNANGAAAEYSRDGGTTWQSSPTFTGLSASTEYSFVARYAKTANYEASPISGELKAKTGPTTSGSGSGNSGSPTNGSASYSVSVPSNVENGTVTATPKSASKGTTVTITATPDAGYELSALTVTDASGNEIKLTDKGNGTYTFIMPASKVTVTANFAEIENEPEPVVNPFTDVFESDYYYDAVLWAVENGVTYGTSATTFSPDLACTRAQIVTFLWRAAGSPEPADNHNPFTDVKASDYYYEAVLWAAENGVTEGTSATTFSPDLACTRDQAVTFLWRAAGKPAPASSVNPFTDVKSGQYYTDAVLWAAENGITEGTSATTFSPGLTCTRAQIVTFLYRNKK